jgi:multidrug efflux pump subunit AcrA (membrane-fusion protein)
VPEPTDIDRPSRRGPVPAAGLRSSPATVVPHARRRWPGRSRRVLGGGVAAAVVLAGGAVLVGQRGSSATAGYRTATVASRPVDQTLERVGTIEPVAQASLSFPVSGTVAAIDVAVGDRVTVGQHLGRLDTTSLDSAVADAEAELDQAELTLERAINGEDVSGGPTGGGAGGLTPASLGRGSGTFVVTLAAATAAGDDPELDAAQQAVLAAQQQVDIDLANAQQALDDAQAICAALSTPEEGTPDTTAPAPDDGVAACQSALVGVLDAQQVVATSQNALADASRALDQLLEERAQDPGTGDPSGDPGTGDPGRDPGTGTPGGSVPDQSGAPQGDTTQLPSGGTGEQPSGGGGDGTGATSSSPTSAELVAYQKAVDAAAAEVAVAEQAAAQATLISPIAGTVQQVGIAAGDAVTAGSSTAAVVVVGDGGYEVTTTVTVDDLPDLEPGQAVTVLADGSDAPADGEVVGIGTVGTSSGSATTYPVTIGLTDPPEGLRNGNTASLSIVTARTDDAVAVPTSAVTVDGGRATVTVLDDGSPTEVTVQTGAVGETWTEITDGLDVGQTVVLADLDAPLPSSATDTVGTGGGLGGPGGFGGAGPRG